VKVYSPSSTKSWLECPRKWSLSKDWQSRLAGKREVGGILGGGFAKGMQTWYGEMARAGDPLQAGEAGRSHAIAEMQQLMALTSPQNSEVEDLLGNVHDLTHSAILKYIAKDPIPQDWKIVDVELEMGEERSRLDLGVRDNSGPAIIDFKLKRKLEARYRAKTIEEYRFNPQQLHYCWRWSQVINEPVLRYYIVLVSLQPTFQASIHQFDVPAQTLKFWVDSYEVHWSRMEGDSDWEGQYPMFPVNEVPGNFNSCLTKFGPCEFQPACHEYHHDPLLMEVEYVRKPTHV
jgi:hypothetical protein